ncbi:MAG TPA: hypothetical protein PLP29_18250 [Candidatus Ozemobacteraceae bacterium]|nr:hypothetical protein [Candidatus Ozemobacteraceae bacterium]
MRRVFSGLLFCVALLACGLLTATAVASSEPEDVQGEYDGPVIRIKRFHEYSKLIVPSSFQGRKGKYNLEGTSLSLFDRIEFRRDQVKTRLKGTVNRFDYDTDVDRLQGMIWRSRADIPGRNSCMDCHETGDSAARTQLWIGRETRFIDPYPSLRDGAMLEIADADVSKTFWELRYWASHRQRIHGGLSQGRMRSFQTMQDAKSAWLGWSWYNHKNLIVNTEWRSSKPELYSMRHEFTGALSYKAGKRLQVGLKGGVLMNGVGAYDLGYSDMGAVTVSTDLYSPETLPSIFQKLRNEQFGYYSIEARYEYAF